MRSRSEATRAWLHGAFAAFVVALATTVPAQQLEDLANFPKATVVIDTAKGAQRIDAWVADTTPRQRQGLMFVRDLPRDQGMVFDYGTPALLSMWMKNTYIPLDILFVDDKGRIVRIAANTTPLSLATISSGKPAVRVVELRGGEAALRGIREGDRLRVEKPPAL